MVSDSNALHVEKTTYLDLFALAGITEKSQFASMYMKELNRLAQIVLSSGDTSFNAEFWKNVQQSTDSFLASITRVTKVHSHGNHGNPLYGSFKRHELIGALLQPVDSFLVPVFDGLKILLLESLSFETISGSYKATTADEIRRGAESDFSPRSGIFRKLPSCTNKNYQNVLKDTLLEISSALNLNQTQKGYVRALGRLISLRLLNDRHKPKITKTYIPPSKQELDLIGSEKSLSLIKQRPVKRNGKSKYKQDRYDVVEPFNGEFEKLGEAPVEARIDQEILNQGELGFDVAANQQGRLSAYWLEQSSWVSPFSSNLIIEPDRVGFCSVIREGVSSEDSEVRFISGLAGICYCTSTKPSLLLGSEKYQFTPIAIVTRKLSTPDASFKPTANDQKEWIIPASEVELKLPDDLKGWFEEFVKSTGVVNIPAKFRSEKELKKSYQQLLLKIREAGHYDITESKIQNALRRELSQNNLGTLIAHLLTSKKGERYPVLNYYAAIQLEQIIDVFNESLEKLWC